MHFQDWGHGISYQYFLRMLEQAWLPMKVMIDEQWLALIGRCHGTW